jgi:hypothetical protein
MNTKRRTTLGWALALSLGLVASIPAAASAQGAKPPAGAKAAGAKGKDKTPPPPAETTTVANPKGITFKPVDLAWGIDRKKLEAIFDKAVDEEFKPKYQKAKIGQEMEMLDAEVAEKKALFRRSYVEFASLATGFDSGPLRAEYGYQNGEAILIDDRGDRRRYYFLFGGRLYKFVDVHKLGEKSKWGKTFDEAVAKLNKAYSHFDDKNTPVTEIQGRRREADAAAGRPFVEVDWKDSKTVVRAIEWGGDELALAFQDPSVAASLPEKRKGKELSNEAQVDTNVTDVMRPKGAPPGPAAPEKGGPKKGAPAGKK